MVVQGDVYDEIVDFIKDKWSQVWGGGGGGALDHLTL